MSVEPEADPPKSSLQPKLWLVGTAAFVVFALAALLATMVVAMVI